MEEIKRQVVRAQRRLVLQQFLTALPWALFAALLIAAAGLAVPKLFVLPVDPQLWLWSWVGGAAAAGFLVAAAITWWRRRSALEAAIEVDRRFGLKERVSSALALSSSELDSEVGRALMSDAIRRVERLDVRERFPLETNWRALLPVAPMLAIVGLLFLDNAQPAKASNSSDPANVKKVVQTTAEKLQQKLRERQKKAAEEGLKESDALLNELNRQVDKLSAKAPTDRKDALIKLNDLSQEVEKRKQQLGGSEELRKQLDKLKDIDKGPADKLADALKDGDFGKAKQELDKLKDQLAAGKLGDEDKQQLAQQLDKMQEKLREAQQARDQAKQDLKDQIKQKMEQGDLAEAGKLQQQLNQMQQQDQQFNQMMDKLANKLGDCAKCMQDPNGDPKDAANKLGELAQGIQELKEQLDELENLDQLMDDLADAKNALRCEECQGAGCKECQGDGSLGKGAGKGKGKGKGNGDGLGEGQGQGLRPEEETDKKFYESRVAGDPKKGESIRTGDAGGPNVAGKTTQSVKSEIEASLRRDPDALNDQALPREQREHARQYFERFRKGE